VACFLQGGSSRGKEIFPCQGKPVVRAKESCHQGETIIKEGVGPAPIPKTVYVEKGVAKFFPSSSSKLKERGEWRVEL